MTFVEIKCYWLSFKAFTKITSQLRPGYIGVARVA